MSTTSAAICRANGWGPGTYLVGDEGYGPTVIKITAVGEDGILARLISHNGVKEHDYESAWTLLCRTWRETEESHQDSAK